MIALCMERAGLMVIYSKQMSSWSPFRLIARIRTAQSLEEMILIEIIRCPTILCCFQFVSSVTLLTYHESCSANFLAVKRIQGIADSSHNMLNYLGINLA